MMQRLFHSIIITLAAGMFLSIAWVTPANAQTAYEHLQKETKPVFKPGYTLPHLSRWGWSLSYDTRVELADHWGYALEMARISPQAVEKLKADLALKDGPVSDDGRILKLAQDHPDRYVLALLVWRPLAGKTLANAAANDPKLAAMKERISVRDAEGKVPEAPAWKLWSPEAPAGIFDWAAKGSAQPIHDLQQLAPKAKIAILLNGGEYGLSVYGHSGKYWAMDPKVVAAKGDMSWYDYTSMKKRDQEMPITQAVTAVAPNRELYLCYHFGGVPTWDGWTWSTNARYTLQLSDYPNQSLYYKHFNTGWTGKNDLLSNFLLSTSQAIELKHPLSYNWYCAGWGKRPFSDEDRYYGFLKANYAAGAIGGVAGYFSYPPKDQGGFNGNLGPKAPSWLWQITALARVHALYSHLEDMLRHGQLLKGDKVDKSFGDHPTYEFNTSDPAVRVVVRKHDSKDLWLACAWAADGPARDVTVEIPDLGPVTLNARPAGSVYLLTKTEPVRYEPPIVTATLIDTDAMLPSQTAEAQVKKATARQ
jgi:hypothetical protein